MDFDEREMRSRIRRKPNFRDDEIWTLIQGIANDRVVIMNKLQTLSTNKNKRDAWRKITKKVNALGVSFRSEKDLKKKWKDLKCAVLNSMHNQKKTRGGYPMRPPPFADIIMDIIGQNTDITAIDVEGTDSFAQETSEGQSEENVVLETTFEGQAVTVHIKDEKMEMSSIVVPIQKPRRPVPPMSLPASSQSPQPGPSRFMSVQPVSTSTSPASDAPSPEATETASTPALVQTPTTANRCVPLVMRSRRRKRHSTSSDTEAEESALFQKWLASDIAKNETKVKLMQLQITKLQHELELE